MNNEAEILRPTSPDASRGIPDTGHGGSPVSIDSTASEAPRPASSHRVRRVIVRILWTAHWAVRIWLAAYLLIYGWSKVYFMQMGFADYSDALVQYGEMSPMGLLWRFMGFSPVVQCLAGLAEVAAGALLLFRRTAWLGAALGAADMLIVFLLNLTFDVPVKQLSGAMALAGIILLAPNFVRVGRFLLGKTAGPTVSGRIWDNRIFIAITKWTAPLFALVLLVGSGVALGVHTHWGQHDDPNPIAGVYRADDTGKRSFEGAEITQIAFGQYGNKGTFRVGIRYSDGSYQDGMYTTDGEDLTLKLFPKLKGDRGLDRDVSATADLKVDSDDAGQLTITGDGLDLTLHSDGERRYLFDRGFSWESNVPINR